MKKAELPHVTFEYREPIVYVNFSKSTTMDEKQVAEMIETRLKLVNNKPHLVLTVFNVPVDFTDEARKVSAAQCPTISIAHAVVVKYVGQRLVTGAYKEIQKPRYPLEIFTNEAEAEKWLLAHMPKKKAMSYKL